MIEALKGIIVMKKLMQLLQVPNLCININVEDNRMRCCIKLLTMTVIFFTLYGCDIGSSQDRQREGESVVNRIVSCVSDADLKKELESLVYERLPEGCFYCDCHMGWGYDFGAMDRIRVLHLPQVVEDAEFSKLQKHWRQEIVKHRVLDISAKKGDYQGCWIVELKIDKESGIRNDFSGKPFERPMKEWKQCPSIIYLRVFRRNGQFQMQNMEEMRRVDEKGVTIPR